MRAEIVTERCSEGYVATAHGMSFEVKRIFVPEARLLITIHHGVLYVRADCVRRKNFKVIGNIEVPDELVNKAVKFTELEKELTSQFVGWLP